MKTLFKLLFLSGLLSPASALYASDSLNLKTISMELAKDIALESIKACRKKGYQVSAVVVDRNGLRAPLLVAYVLCVT